MRPGRTRRLGFPRARPADAVLPLLSADTFVARLGRLGSARGLPHLVFLAACEGAKPEAESALGSLAQRLVRELGVPAVVAMTDRVSIATAADLATRFYGRLRELGEPDVALVQARAGLTGRADGLVPALFTRLAGRPLFCDRLRADRVLTAAERAAARRHRAAAQGAHRLARRRGHGGAAGARGPARLLDEYRAAARAGKRP